MFFNMAAWKAPAPHIQLIVTQNFTERATAERNDLLKLTRREQRGTIFNKPDGEPFGEALRKAGSYPETKKYNARSYLLAAGAVHRRPAMSSETQRPFCNNPGHARALRPPPDSLTAPPGTPPYR